MAAPMLSGNFRNVVAPILNEVFDGVYDQRTDEWKGPLQEITSPYQRDYYEEPVLYGFNAAPEMPPGTPVVYNSGGQLFVKRYQFKVYGLAFALSKVLVEDGDHIAIGKIYAEHLAQSQIETVELKAANLFNRAFSSSYPGGDGVSLINASHPIIAGTYSNVLATPAALSQTSVEQMLVQIRSAVDANGKHINLIPRALVTAPANVFQAEVVLESPLRAGTSTNDLNPVKSLGLLKEGQYNMTRLTSSTAWFIVTNAPFGNRVVWRRKVEKSMEGDFETDSMRYKTTMRLDIGWTNPLGTYGTAGL